jgi:hypothetical protein
MARQRISSGAVNPGDSQTGSKDAAHRVHERQSRQGRLSISLINEP